MKKITKSTLSILLMLVFITSCKQAQKKQLPTEAELKFSEALMSNFSEKGFLKEEEDFASKYNKEAKRPYEIYEELGMVLYQQQKTDQAILVFARSAEIYENNEDIVSTLAILHEKTNNKPAAIKNISLALVIAQKNKNNYGERFYTSELKRLKRRDAKPGVDIMFDEDAYPFSQKDKELITTIIIESEKKARALLPTLPNDIRFLVNIIDREIDLVGGIAGRAETHTPGEVLVEISNVYPGGVNKAIRTSLAATIFHELHHVNRGWTMKRNKFGPGIPNAMVNEGLAVAFAEIHTKQVFEGNSYPKEVDSWVKEVLLLPINANYSEWVSGEHPDGRFSIGYRAGNYLVRKAMKNSGKDIVTLSKLSPDEILVLADYK